MRNRSGEIFDRRRIRRGLGGDVAGLEKGREEEEEEDKEGRGRVRSRNIPLEVGDMRKG